MSGHAQGIEMSSIPDHDTHEDTQGSFAIEDEEQGLNTDEAAEDEMLGPGGARRRSIAHSLTDAGSITGPERRLAARGFWRRMMVNGTLITLWYLFSISITVYNKWMFSAEDGKTPPPVEGEDPPKKNIVFPYPLFTTCVHMLVQFGLASLVLYFIPKFRPGHSNTDHHDHGHNRSRGRENKGPVMTYWFYLTRIGPCGAATSLDIGLGNMSFKYITLTFYTMCKSSVLGFVLFFAFIFGLEKPSWKLGGIIATMTLGVFLMVAGEASFNVLGFALIMSSAASSGFRWSLTQILLIHNPATSNPFSSIFFLAPIMFVTLLLLATPVEGFGNMTSAFTRLGDEHGYLTSTMYLLFPGCLAFLMTASEFALLQRTSVVTLSICGIFKEVLTISTASIVFKDELSTVNGIGLGITILTIGVYNYFKIQKMKEEAEAEVHGRLTGFDIDGNLSSGSNGFNQDYVVVAGEDEDEERRHNRNVPGLMKGLNVAAVTISSGRVESPKPSPVKRPEDLE